MSESNELSPRGVLAANQYGRIYLDNEMPVAEFFVGQNRYSFSVQGFPKNSYEWLLKVVGHHMQEIHTRGVAMGENQILDDIYSAMRLSTRARS